jgi:hypothetical protein
LKGQFGVLVPVFLGAALSGVDDREIGVSSLISDLRGTAGSALDTGHYKTKTIFQPGHEVGPAPRVAIIGDSSGSLARGTGRL